jgi:hypothetical protein
MDSHQDFDESGLAGAIVAYQANYLTIPNFKINTV